MRFHHSINHNPAIYLKPANRVFISMAEDDVLIVFQVGLGRLPQGKELTEEEILKAWDDGKAYFVLVYSPAKIEPPKQ